MLEALTGGLVRGFYIVPLVVGCLLTARHGSYLPLWLPQVGMVSAYCYYLLGERWALPLAPAMVLSVATGTALGLVLHRLFFQRFVESKEPYHALLYALALITLLTSSFGLLTSGYPASFQRARGSWQVFVGWPVADTLRLPDLVAIIGAVVLVAALAWFVGRTRLGLEYRALSSNRSLALEYGLRVARLDVAIPALAALLCAFGGLVYGLNFGASPSFMVPVSIKAIAVVVALGSRGGVLTAAAAAVGLGLVEAAVKATPEISVFEQGVAYLVLVLALLVQFVLAPRLSRLLWHWRDRRAVA